MFENFVVLRTSFCKCVPEEIPSKCSNFLFLYLSENKDIASYSLYVDVPADSEFYQKSCHHLLITYVHEITSQEQMKKFISNGSAHFTTSLNTGPAQRLVKKKKGDRTDIYITRCSFLSEQYRVFFYFYSTRGTLEYYLYIDQLEVNQLEETTKRSYVKLPGEKITVNKWFSLMVRIKKNETAQVQRSRRTGKETITATVYIDCEKINTTDKLVQSGYGDLYGRATLGMEIAYSDWELKNTIKDDKIFPVRRLKRIATMISQTITSEV